MENSVDPLLSSVHAYVT